MNTPTVNQEAKTATKDLKTKAVNRPTRWFKDAGIQTHEDGATIWLPLAGYQKSEISIAIKNNLLTISAEVAETKEAAKFLRREFTKRSFSRSFKLDESIDPEKVDATMENGVLQVTLSKKPAYTEVKKIEIQ